MARAATSATVFQPKELARAPRLSRGDTAAVLLDVLAPFAARGAIARRQRVEGLADRLDADRRALRRMRLVHQRYGNGPALLGIPGREVALVLSADHATRVLEGSWERFDPANHEKRAALSHFQPHGVLVSHGNERAERRCFNEAVLDSGCPIHRLGPELVTKVGEEAAAITDAARRSGSLGWDEFAQGWWRMVRRVVLGDEARDDHVLTDILMALRKDANWAYLKPKRTRLRERFAHRLEQHLSRAEPGSLAALLASTPAAPGTCVAGQVPHWLFAFDAAGMASFRTLALLDGHPSEAGRAREELGAADLSVPQELPFLRACVLESLRLWPTTPAILRDTTTETDWDGRTLPPGTALLIFAPYFHRDPRRLPHADAFAPAIWLNEDPQDGWPLVPFSAGPADCPGRDLVLLLTSHLLAALLSATRLHQAHRRPLTARAPLPSTLSPFRLRFEIAAGPQG